MPTEAVLRETDDARRHPSGDRSAAACVSGHAALECRATGAPSRDLPRGPTGGLGQERRHPGISQFVDHRLGRLRRVRALVGDHRAGDIRYPQSTGQDAVWRRHGRGPRRTPRGHRHAAVRCAQAVDQGARAEAAAHRRPDPRLRRGGRRDDAEGIRGRRGRRQAQGPGAHLPAQERAGGAGCRPGLPAGHRIARFRSELLQDTNRAASPRCSNG